MDDDTFNKYDRIVGSMSDRIDVAIKESHKGNKDKFVGLLKNEELFAVIYSAYEVKDDLPVDNLDEVAFEGTFTVVGEYDEFWDGHGGMLRESTERCGREYKSEPITNPTWLQLAVLANESIITTNDRHHVFFEIAKQQQDRIYLSFGS
jgi:hypothetical protein